jgi:hypothetical protein
VRAAAANPTSSANGRPNPDRGYVETIESQVEIDEGDGLNDDALAEQQSISELQLSFRCMNSKYLYWEHPNAVCREIR